MSKPTFAEDMEMVAWGAGHHEKDEPYARVVNGYTKMEEENQRLRKGLEDIIKHHETVLGNVGQGREFSTTIRIAEIALGRAK